jgi:hypothetical protein
MKSIYKGTIFSFFLSFT